MIQEDLLLEQLHAVLLAVQAGIACGILYDILRMIRYRHGRICEFFLDVFFSCIASGTIFILVIGVAQVRFRGFLLIAFGMGWAAWRMTAGRLFCRIFRKRRKKSRSVKISKKLRKK